MRALNGLRAAGRAGEVDVANLAPVSRRLVAEALVTSTVALVTVTREPSSPGAGCCGRALFAWAFNPATRGQVPPPDIAAALDWRSAPRCRSAR